MIKFVTLIVLKIFDHYFQKRMFRFLKKKGISKFDIFFDIGAHRGETIQLFAKNFKIKNFYSFEASQTNFEFLKRNSEKFSKKNPNINIKIKNVALGNEKKQITIKHLSESSSSTINEIDISSKYFKKKSFFLYDNKDRNNFYIDETTQQIKLEDFILDNNIDKIDFLKIDTEGYEIKVLQGLGNQFKKVSVIMFEHHYHNMIIKNYKFSDINNFLKKNNFKQIYKYKMPFRKTFEYIYVKKHQS